MRRRAVQAINARSTKEAEENKDRGKFLLELCWIRTVMEMIKLPRLEGEFGESEHLVEMKI